MPFLMAQISQVPTNTTMPFLSIPILIGVAVAGALAVGYRYKPKPSDLLEVQNRKKVELFCYTLATGYIMARPTYAALAHFWPKGWGAPWEGLDALIGVVAGGIALPLLLTLYKLAPARLARFALSKVPGGESPASPKDSNDET